MKFSTKSSYGILSLIYIGKKQNFYEYVSLGAISQYLNISKIYLEQIFTLFRKNNIVISAKGANGGYRLNKSIKKISIYNILLALESSEIKPNPGFKESNNFYKVLEGSVISSLEEVIESHLKSITLEMLISKNIELDKINNIYYI